MEILEIGRGEMSVRTGFLRSLDLKIRCYV